MYKHSSKFKITHNFKGLRVENIFEQIDSIFCNDPNHPPQWAMELLIEIREVKQLLLQQKQKSASKQRISKEFYQFIKDFRKSMQPLPQNDFYPTYTYKGKKLGIDFKGLLYDKTTTNYISRAEAYEVYEFAYKEHVTKFSA